MILKTLYIHEYDSTNNYIVLYTCIFLYILFNIFNVTFNHSLYTVKYKRPYFAICSVHAFFSGNNAFCLAISAGNLRVNFSSTNS